VDIVDRGRIRTMVELSSLGVRDENTVVVTAEGKGEVWVELGLSSKTWSRRCRWEGGCGKGDQGD
jgi:hypothetical protein